MIRGHVHRQGVKDESPGTGTLLVVVKNAGDYFQRICELIATFSINTVGLDIDRAVLFITSRSDRIADGRTAQLRSQKSTDIGQGNENLTVEVLLEIHRTR